MASRATGSVRSRHFSGAAGRMLSDFWRSLNVGSNAGPHGRKMMTQVGTQQNSPMRQLREGLLRALETHKSQIRGRINDRHVLIACQQIQANPALLKCTPQSIFAAIVRAGLYGWVCDGLIGQGYLVPFKNEAVLIAGYKGLRDLVRRSGQADTLMDAVHEGDTFVWNGPFEAPTHVKAKDRHAKAVIGAYCCVYFHATKTVKSFWWPVEEILAHRDRYSKGWTRNPNPDNPWHPQNPAFPIMCQKTVLRAVINRGEAPISIEDRALARDYDEEEPVAAIPVPEIPMEPTTEANGESPHPAEPSASQPMDEKTPQPAEAKKTEQPGQNIESPHAQPSEKAASEAATEAAEDDPLAAEERQRESDALEAEYMEHVIPHIRLETDAKRQIADIDGRSGLSYEAKQRLIAAIKSQVQIAKATRGERSNQRNMIEK